MDAKEAAEIFAKYNDTVGCDTECRCSECGEYIAWEKSEDENCLCWRCKLEEVIQAAIDAALEEKTALVIASDAVVEAERQDIEIECLKAENAKLREALKPFGEVFERWSDLRIPGGIMSLMNQIERGERIEMFRLATATLKPDKGE